MQQNKNRKKTKEGRQRTDAPKPGASKPKQDKVLDDCIMVSWIARSTVELEIDMLYVCL